MRRGREVRDAFIFEKSGITGIDIRVSPKDYQKLVDQISGKPEERILSYLMLRSLKQACYSPLNKGHFGLASACYTHFTSPIRRYPDLMVHRILRNTLQLGTTSSWASSRRMWFLFEREPLPESPCGAILRKRKPPGGPQRKCSKRRRRFWK